MAAANSITATECNTRPAVTASGKAECSVEGCTNHVKQRGWCGSHYARWRRHGDPLGGGTGHGAFQKFLQKNPHCSIEGCEKKPFNSRGWCEMHYARWRKHGSPLGGGTWKGECLKWLQDRVNYSDEECLIWPFSRNRRNRSGYGTLLFQGRTTAASRVMCFLIYGDPPHENAEAAHSCGNGHMGCVNPRHLRWATVSGNQMDRVGHGTSNRGERHPLSKLKESQVREIRRLEGQVGKSVLAERFGITESYVRVLQMKKRWKWLK